MPGAVDDLTALALAARDGDRVALAVRAEQPGEVWRLCARLTARDVADDVTHDVYMRALGALPSFRGDLSARTWLLSIAHRACVDHVRRVQRRRRARAHSTTGDHRPWRPHPTVSSSWTCSSRARPRSAHRLRPHAVARTGVPGRGRSRRRPVGTIRSRWRGPCATHRGRGETPQPFRDARET